MQSNLEWIQAWYAAQCDGEWEHQYGITIETMDNPGWSVRIALTETAMQGKTMEAVRVDHGEKDWMQCFLREDVFCGYGDPTKLEKILQVFREALWT